MTQHTRISTQPAAWSLIVLAALLLALVSGVGRAAAADCQFVLGFQSLHAMIPDTVGDCVENEQHHPGDGVTLQRTTHGLLVWEKATNHTAFTDGYHTWVVGPYGLQQRLNTERFDWEPPAASTDARALTRAYVEAAIAYYEQHGLEATLAYYNSPESIEGERGMIILRAGDQTLLAHGEFPRFIGASTYFAPDTPLGANYAQATPEGHWYRNFDLDATAGQQVPLLSLAILHDGLIFASGHAIVREDLADFTLDYVQKAIAFYDREGLAATIGYYGSRESVDEQFYLFLIGADDLYLAHPIFPHLIGTDIKDVKDSAGYELGKEIAQATAAGHWVDYLWPNPVSGIEEPKSAWVIRHDGLIFASGYYLPDPDAEPPAWKGADPREYTVTYVEKAIARYDRDGLETMKHYYNSVAGFEGQWYLFVMDANDIYIVHPLIPWLIGTDLKDVVSSDGQELGKEIAQATAAGIWVEYLWPHPASLEEVPKVAYAVRHDGLIFASGYYPELEDPRAYTQAYVAEAIAYYDANGRDATVAHYNSPASVDGQWVLLLVDEHNAILANVLNPSSIGRDVTTIGGVVIEGIDEAMASVTEAGQWTQHRLNNPLTAEDDQLHMWSIRHDGLIFASQYFASE